MLKMLFELATDSLAVFENPLHNYFAMAAIGAIAFAAGWEVSPGGRWGSTIHWGVRFLVFVVLWAIMRGCVLLYRWVCSIPVGVIVAFVVGLLCLTASVAVLIKKRRDRIPVPNNEGESK